MVSAQNITLILIRAKGALIPKAQFHFVLFTFVCKKKKEEKEWKKKKEKLKGYFLGQIVLKVILRLSGHLYESLQYEVLHSTSTWHNSRLLAKQANCIPRSLGSTIWTSC